MRAAGSDQPPAISRRLDVEDVRIRGGVGAWIRLAAVAIINLFIALLWLGLLAWLTGRVLTDRLAWSQWLWWIPTPAVVVAAVIGWLLSFRAARMPSRRRRRILAWTACGILVAAYFALIEHRLLRAAPVPPPGGLTIAHWNMTLDNHADIPGLMAAVAALDADVLALTSPPGEVRRLLHEQADASGGTLHIVDGAPVMLVSRVPVTHWRILVASDRMFVTQVDLDAGAALGRAVTVFLVDLPSSPTLPRVTIAREVCRLLDLSKGSVPDLCLGDFNIPRGSASIDALFPAMTYAFNQAGHGYGASFHRRFPLYHLDHVLLRNGSGLRAARYDLIDETQGRHRAQKAWIAVTPANSH